MTRNMREKSLQVGRSIELEKRVCRWEGALNLRKESAGGKEH